MNIQQMSKELFGYIRDLTEAAKALKPSKFSTAQELIPEIEKAIKKHFPKSMIRARFEKSFNPKEGNIFFEFAVAGSKDEVSGKLWDNDIGHTKVLIWGMDNEGKFHEKLKFNPVIGGSIFVKTTDPRMRAYDSVKVGLRKKTGTPEQVIKHIDSYFKKLLATLKANKDKLPEDVRKLKSVNLK